MTHNYSVNFKLIHFLLWTKGSHQSPNFDTFKCFGENLLNFSSLFSNHKSVFLQNLHISSVSWKITPLYFCSSNNIYFGHKEPIKTPNFLDFRVLGLKFVKFLMSILKQKVSYSSIFVSFFIVMTYNSSVNVKLGQKDSIKVPILTFLSALLKFCQIPDVIFQTASQFFFKFCITLQCHDR